MLKNVIYIFGKLRFLLSNIRIRQFYPSDHGQHQTTTGFPVQGPALWKLGHGVVEQNACLCVQLCSKRKRRARKMNYTCLIALPNSPSSYSFLLRGEVLSTRQEPMNNWKKLLLESRGRKKKGLPFPTPGVIYNDTKRWYQGCKWFIPIDRLIVSSVVYMSSERTSGKEIYEDKRMSPTTS